MIQTSLRTPLKLHTPTFLACAAFSLLPLLPSRASVLSLFADFRLLSSPCALVSVGPLCPPCCSWSWLVLLPPSPLWVWFFLLAWPVFCLVCLCGAFLCCLSPAGFSVRFVLLLFPPLPFFSGSFVCFAPTCATKVLVYHCTCVFFRPTPSWLSPGRSTCFIACCKLGLID